MARVKVTILGLSSSPSSVGTFALILAEEGGKRRLPIIIGSSEAQSIALELENIKPPRPLTHDLIKNILDVFNASVNEVVIDDLKDGVFFAKISIEISGLQTIIDSRPSDAIALAVRSQCNIFVKEEIMNEASIEQDNESIESDIEIEKLSESETTISPKKQEKPKDQLPQLEKELNQAIQNEDYEKAARLRDEINKLKK